MASNLPSSFSRPNAGGSSAYSAPYSPPSSGSQPRPQAPSMPVAGENNIQLYVAVLALLVALASFYGTFFVDKPLSPSQKAELAGVANDLRSLQNRDITLSAPIQTTVTLDKAYPISDLFPASFEIPLEFTIPIDTQLIAVGAGGQPVSFRVQESVPIKASIPIVSTTAFRNESIRIRKEMPVEARFTSTVKIRAAYGQELNSMIDRLDKLAGEPVTSG